MRTCDDCRKIKLDDESCQLVGLCTECATDRLDYFIAFREIIKAEGLS